MFLVGKQIPDHITSLPETVMNTPFGQMLKPKLEGAMQELTHAPIPTTSRPPTSPSVPNGTHTISSPSISSAGMKQHFTPGGIVHNVTGLMDLERLLESAKKTCAAIFFTSSTCAPCKICYPAYNELAREAGNKAVLIKVDLNQSFDIGPKFKVRATPTFMTFLNGEKVEEWSGAEPSKLLANIRLLIQMAHPPHPHTNLRLPTLQRVHEKPVTYAKVPPLNKLIAKIGPAGTNPDVTALKDFITVRTSSAAANVQLPRLPNISSVIRLSLTSLPPSSLFPLIDLLRLALVDSRVSGYFAEARDDQCVLAILSHINSLGDKCPYALRVVTLQMACNLFTSSLYPPYLFGNTQLTDPLLHLVTSSLLDIEHVTVRVSAASLAFNISSYSHLQRLRNEADALSQSVQVELAVSLLEAVGREKESKDGLKGLISALGLLAYRCAQDGELRDVLVAMGARDVVKEKKELMGEESQLVDEVIQVLN